MKTGIGPVIRFCQVVYETMILKDLQSKPSTDPAKLITEAVPPIPGVVPETVFINSESTDQTEYLTAELGFKGVIGKFRLDVSGFYAQANGVIGFDSGNLIVTQSPLNP